MSFRRRHRWLRRLAVGLALVTAVGGGRVSVAAAKFEEGAAVRNAATDPYLTDVFVRPGESVGAPDGIASSPTVSSARPDDDGARFAHSSVAPQPELAGSSGWTFDQDEALALGLGAIVLGLGLGLAIGHLRRPRLAGL
jgi:hypothetical protein